ncbi:hypothetical protein J421_6220 (plasmid) [Gemmatirosa kalamazoonensis]|uniref:Uncharacterized protein n=1 Tax=Gemmatirosa kalamazoonensis TaxID=861299 RepID=W0RTY4_9BACT|nr:hypothetical protein [Gemmatirosa kalamazoonensis]AHG93755.1 hypothetical protein J421_6220 [Gemmatirosa kalamazoonensis]
MERSRAAFKALAAPDASPAMADSARRVIDASPFAALFEVQIPIPDGMGPSSPAPRQRPAAPPPGAMGRDEGPSLPVLAFVEPAELPDYKPAFAAGAVRADADGNLWVREIPTHPYPGPVYAVIDGAGRLADRVLLPRGTAIAGFGPRGVVYLGMRDGDAVRLMRARR